MIRTDEELLSAVVVFRDTALHQPELLRQTVIAITDHIEGLPTMDDLFPASWDAS